MPARGLRFLTVYGPWGRPDMAPILFAKTIPSGQPIQVFHQVQMQRDFTYIDDIVEGVIRCLDKPATADSNFDPANPNPANEATALYRVAGEGSRPSGRQRLPAHAAWRCRRYRRRHLGIGGLVRFSTRYTS